MSRELEIGRIEKRMFELEKQFDQVNSEGRKLVRFCSNTIKAIHASDFKEAKTNLAQAKSGIDLLLKSSPEFKNHLNHVLQEYAEAQIVYWALEKKKIPKFSELNVPELPYVLGLLDSIGELKREMYESLRRGKKKDAETYFQMMEDIYDALLPLRFSNAILPEFRHKQDVGRLQIEQARGELI